MVRKKFLAASGLIVCAALALGLFATPKAAAAGKADVAKGKEAFEQCAICHNVDNDEKKMGPSLKGLFKRKTLASGKPVNDANVMAQINAGGNGMPAYSDMLSADDKANIMAYLHTL
jgi:cytochrome c